MPKSSKLMRYINYRMRITIQDSRTFVGKMMAFDKHMNVVLSDCEEYRKITPKGKKGIEKIQKRMLGFLILRGEVIVTMTVESPPTPSNTRVKLDKTSGILDGGTTKSVSRGVPVSTESNSMLGIKVDQQFNTQQALQQGSNLQLNLPLQKTTTSNVVGSSIQQTQISPSVGFKPPSLSGAFSPPTSALSSTTTATTLKK